jgi:hypothetical protein
LPGIGPDTRLRRSKEPIGADVEGGVVLVSLKANAYVSLNETAASIWRLLETPMTAAALCERLAQEYDNLPDDYAIHAVSAAGQLVEAGILEVESD